MDMKKFDKLNEARDHFQIKVILGLPNYFNWIKYYYLERILKFCGYSGTWGLDNDVMRCEGVSWAKRRFASGVLSDKNISPRMKDKFHQSVVRLAMLYGAECWVVKKIHARHLHAVEILMLRWMSGQTRLDKILGEVIRGWLGMTPLEDKLREARLRWFNHVKLESHEHSHQNDEDDAFFGFFCTLNSCKT
ncbi:unnamed protein product [Cuscuta campestris]|uniref:Uncharacterized protein n=1 Tax=Cuscuta campestris TaxID=132261 RepID=A0A484KEA2_9ASTE|nr:unnamed protein product [Cuscuta campestris]